MDLRMQVKLLRALQERVVRRLGGTQDIKFTANIVAATNKDLAAGVASKTFREDLYYRLNTLPLLVPPLRSRTEDIMPLADFFLKHSGSTKKFKGFSQAAAKAMAAYRWPGNVRELKSVIDRAAILEKGPQMELMGFRQETMRGVATVTALPVSEGPSPGPMANSGEGATVLPLKRSGAPNQPGSGVVDVGALMVEGKTFADIRKEADEHFVREILGQYLGRAEGNVSQVARMLKMDRANLLRMFRRYHIDPDLFRKKLEEAA
jgi:DNA-binding NtrC family response regulator